MRKFKFEQVNSTPYKGLDGTVIFGDGTDPTHKILIEAVNGLGVPQSIVQTQQAPFQVGASPIRVTYGPRTISLECAIIIDCKNEAGKAAMELIKRDLGKKFSPVGMGYVTDTSLTGSNYSTVTGKLSYASDGVTYDRFIDCVPISCEFPNRSYSDGFQRFRLALLCHDPTWYDVEQSSVMTAVGVGISGAWTRSIYADELGMILVNATGSSACQASYDGGVSWVSIITNVSLDNCRIAWSGSLMKFCALKYGTSTVYNSTDGITWTTHTGAYVGDHNVVKWVEKIGLFVCLSTGLLMQASGNGTTWTSYATVSNSVWSSFDYSDELGVAVAVASGSTAMMTSSNCTTWSSTTAALSGNSKTVLWSRTYSLFVCMQAGANFETSPNGTSWTSRANSSNDGWTGFVWVDRLGAFFSAAATTNKGQVSYNGTSFSAVTLPASNNWLPTSIYAQRYGSVVTVSQAALQYPIITYDLANWFQSTTSDYTKQITNSGDVPAEFEIDIPVAGGETGKVIAIGDNFLWSGTGTPPSDHNLVFGTDGLKKGIVTVSTKFNDKDIRQFGVSKFNLYQQGTFFSLYVSGATTNNIYVRNTGTSAGAPTIRWKNRYLGV